MFPIEFKCLQFLTFREWQTTLRIFLVKNKNYSRNACLNCSWFIFPADGSFWFSKIREQFGKEFNFICHISISFSLYWTISKVYVIQIRRKLKLGRSANFFDWFVFSFADPILSKFANKLFSQGKNIGRKENLHDRWLLAPTRVIN